MSDPMTMKWAIVDLLKICDAAHEGRLHGDLARIARTLGVELTPPVIDDGGLAIVIEGPDPVKILAGEEVLPFGKAKKATRSAN